MKIIYSFSILISPTNLCGATLLIKIVFKLSGHFNGTHKSLIFFSTLVILQFSYWEWYAFYCYIYVKQCKLVTCVWKKADRKMLWMGSVRRLLASPVWKIQLKSLTSHQWAVTEHQSCFFSVVHDTETQGNSASSSSLGEEIILVAGQ